VAETTVINIRALISIIKVKRK